MYALDQLHRHSICIIRSRPHSRVQQLQTRSYPNLTLSNSRSNKITTQAGSEQTLHNNSQRANYSGLKPHWRQCRARVDQRWWLVSPQRPSMWAESGVHLWCKDPNRCLKRGRKVLTRRRIEEQCQAVKLKTIYSISSSPRETSTKQGEKAQLTPQRA